MRKTFLSWVLLAGFCLTAISSASAQATAAGRIVLARVTGEVTVVDKATQASVAARNNQEIGQGFIVNTAKGASVVMVFSNGATINLKEDSVLDIEQYLQDPFAGNFDPSSATDEPSVSNTGLRLTRGEMVGNVKKLKAGQGSTFNVQTPVGAAGIRGTTFRIVYRPAGNGTAFFSLTTTEGNVVLSTGTVTLPVGAVDNVPKEVVFEAQVNPTTGVVTITTPTATIAVVTAAPTTVAEVTVARAEVIQAVTTVVFTPPVVTTPPPTTPQPETPPAPPAPPPPPATPTPVPPPQTLTSGAGGGL